MKNMAIDDRLLFFGRLFISLSATQFLLSHLYIMSCSFNVLPYSYLPYNDKRKVNWVSLVKTLLCNLGFYDVWVNQ